MRFRRILGTEVPVALYLAYEDAASVKGLGMAPIIREALRRYAEASDFPKNPNIRRTLTTGCVPIVETPKES